MRHLLAFVLMIALVGSAAAADLGIQLKDTKTNNHVMMNPGTPDGRDGGESMADAVMIGALPFSDTGNTCDNVDDYDVACPYSGSTSADVVYSYTPAADEVLFIDLCGSGYDTKVYVLDGDMNVIACNDDAYFDEVCGTYVSAIDEAFVTAGVEYFVVIDGYGGDCGDFVLYIEGTDPPEPCIIDANDDEMEPEMSPGYVDMWNSGCNDESGLFPFQELVADEYGMLNFGGDSGWLGGGLRDTDWFIATLGETGIANWTLDAEQETYGFILGPQDCASVGVLESFIAGPCTPASITIQGNPGDLVWLWIGPTTYDAPAGFVGYEYNYVADFDGLEAGTVATEAVSFDQVKSLYR